jgi:hypothetical protein
MLGQPNSMQISRQASRNAAVSSKLEETQLQGSSAQGRNLGPRTQPRLWGEVLSAQAQGLFVTLEKNGLWLSL